MRTEEILNEAKGFNQEKMAYIHAELYQGGRGTVVVSGDETAIVISIYNLIEAFAQNRYEDPTFAEIRKEVRKVFKALRKLYRLTKSRGECMFDKSEMEEE